MRNTPEMTTTQRSVHRGSSIKYESDAKANNNNNLNGRFWRTVVTGSYRRNTDGLFMPGHKYANTCIIACVEMY